MLCPGECIAVAFVVISLAVSIFDTALVCDDEMDIDACRRMAIETDLRRILELMVHVSTFNVKKWKWKVESERLTTYYYGLPT